MIPKAESRTFFRALGKHLTELRKGIGMTQAELSRALGVSQQTVFAYELGDRRVSVLMLVKLARIFDTSVEEMSGLKMQIRPKRRLSPAGVRHAERYQTLSKTRQRFVGKLMDLLLQEQSALASKWSVVAGHISPGARDRGFVLSRDPLVTWRASWAQYQQGSLGRQPMPQTIH